MVTQVSSSIRPWPLENVLLTGECSVAADLAVYKEMKWTDLQTQIGLFRSKRSVKSLSDAVGILRGMTPELRGEYDEVETLVRLLLVSPACIICRS